MFYIKELFYEIKSLDRDEIKHNFEMKLTNKLVIVFIYFFNTTNISIQAKDDWLISKIISWSDVFSYKIKSVKFQFSKVTLEKLVESENLASILLISSRFFHFSLANYVT